MDYEKLHKDTIAKLQEMVNSGKITVKTACGICADFVPESEDERIRKALIEAFFRPPGHNCVNVFNGIPHRKIVTWLEKQGEQNPAWSEEDEKMLRGIINDFSDELDEEMDENEIEIITNKISFLKSLEPHPIHKWNREDNRIRLEITNYLECQKREEPTRTDILNKWIAWIANLDPQGKQESQWKPSEEQMEALKEACDEHWEPDDLDPLYTLYQDLKKLKEE